ncbi:MAG: DNA mismatch repair protein MutT [Pseudomonadota bacterium]
MTTTPETDPATTAPSAEAHEAAENPAKDAIRDAATVVLIRRDSPMPRVLMGQRGKKAAFMPSKFVFPGGAVDRADGGLPDLPALPPSLEGPLSARSDPGLALPLALAAIRELWEEAGLALAHPGNGPQEVPQAWQGFYQAGHRPAVDRLQMIFRAITPPGRPRRFDARFLMAEAADLAGDAEDFSRAEDELSHLSWLTLAEARRLDLPFITEVVLAEIEARLDPNRGLRPVPFFHHAEGRSFLDPV